MREIIVRAGAARYRVLVGRGLLRTVGEEVRALGRGPRCALIADANSGKLFGEDVRAAWRWPAISRR